MNAVQSKETQAAPPTPYRPDWQRIGQGFVDVQAVHDFAAVLPKSTQLEGPSSSLVLGRAGW